MGYADFGPCGYLRIDRIDCSIPAQRRSLSNDYGQVDGWSGLDRFRMGWPVTGELTDFPPCKFRRSSYLKKALFEV